MFCLNNDDIYVTRKRPVPSSAWCAIFRGWTWIAGFPHRLIYRSLNWGFGGWTKDSWNGLFFSTNGNLYMFGWKTKISIPNNMTSYVEKRKRRLNPFSESLNWNMVFRNQKVGTRHSETKGGTGHSETKGGVNGAFRNQWGC